MSNKTTQEPLGHRQADAAKVRQCLKELGLPQAWLANKADLSLNMVNLYLNGKRKLSPAASDRVLTVINAAFDKKNAAEKPRLTPEERIRQRAAKLLEEIPDEKQRQYDDVRNAVNSFILLSAREALISLGGPPRDPQAYEAWKAKQIELHAAANELPVAKAWIARQDKQVANLQKQVSGLEREVSILDQIKSRNDELIFLLSGSGGTIERAVAGRL